MNSGSTKVLSCFAAVAVLGLLSGCFEKRVVWSPDGARAAIITPEGLRLCDPEGNLSPLLLPGVTLATWLDSSEALVLVRQRNVATWNDLAATLSRRELDAIAAVGEEVRSGLDQGGLWSVAFIQRENTAAVQIFLRDRYGGDLRAKIGDAWNDLASVQAEINEVLLARAGAGNLAVGPSLHAGLQEVLEVRAASGGKALACVLEPRKGRVGGDLLLVQPGAPRAGTIVAEGVAIYPDWTADGRALVYMQAETGASDSSDIVLGTLVQREVFDIGGALTEADEVHELAGVLFNQFGRVRCLRDGRIIFDASELTLPLALSDSDGTREQLFALDLARQATLVRLIPRKAEGDLPEMLAFFEVSPDEKQILIGGMKGETCVFSVATGDVEIVQAASTDDEQGAPVWRRAGEVTYLRRYPRLSDGAIPPRRAELVLRRDGNETVLSAAWPDAMVNAVLE